MKWSPEEWEKNVERLVHQCEDKVLIELEEGIMARLRETGETIIQSLFEAPANLVITGTEKPKEDEEGIVSQMLNSDDNNTCQVKKVEGCDFSRSDPASLINEEVFYAFGITKADQETISLFGMEDRPCHLVENGNLGMLVCPVSLSEYNEDSLHCHMEDMAWVESHARRHEEVILKIMDDKAVIPLPFCTIYTNENNIKQQLTKNAAMIYDDLRRLENHHEMHVKLFVNRQRLLEKLQEDLPFVGDQNGGGYFQKLQWEKKLNAEMERVMEEYGESLYQDLNGISVEGILLEKSEVVVQEGQCLVFAVHYLISKECREEWNKRLKLFDELADPLGFMVEVSGPWPPYHFSRLKNEEEKTGG